MKARTLSLVTRQCRESCAMAVWMIFCALTMIDKIRQLPSPSATAWLFDLGGHGGPWIVVLRDVDCEARERLAEHLVSLGKAADVAAAMAMLTCIRAEHAGVLW